MPFPIKKTCFLKPTNYITHFNSFSVIITKVKRTIKEKQLNPCLQFMQFLTWNKKKYNTQKVKIIFWKRKLILQQASELVEQRRLYKQTFWRDGDVFTSEGKKERLFSQANWQQLLSVKNDMISKPS